MQKSTEEPEGIENGRVTRRYVPRLVRQEDRSGCAIACVAMLSGKTYDEAKKAWLSRCKNADEFQLRAVGNGAGMTCGEVLDLMDALKVPRSKLVEAPFMVAIDRGESAHFIVIDQKGRILDPLNVERSREGGDQPND